MARKSHKIHAKCVSMLRATNNRDGLAHMEIHLYRHTNNYVLNRIDMRVTCGNGRASPPHNCFMNRRDQMEDVQTMQGGVKDPTGALHPRLMLRSCHESSLPAGAKVARYATSTCRGGMCATAFPKRLFGSTVGGQDMPSSR